MAPLKEVIVHEFEMKVALPRTGSSSRPSSRPGEFPLNRNWILFGKSEKFSSWFVQFARFVRFVRFAQFLLCPFSSNSFNHLISVSVRPSSSSCSCCDLSVPVATRFLRRFLPCWNCVSCTVRLPSVRCATDVALVVCVVVRCSVLGGCAVDHRQ